MANIMSIDVKGDKFRLELEISETEYKSLSSEVSDIILIPVDAELMPYKLTLGTLGNSYRMMLPVRVLSKHGISKLPRKAPAKIIEYEGAKYVVARISGVKGIPEFEENVERKQNSQK